MAKGARRALAAVLALGGLLGSGGAASDAPRDAQVRLDRVALFKNGLAFVASTATLPEAAQAVRLGQLPVPSYGTFWVGYPQQIEVRSVVASMEELIETVPVESLGQLLHANQGRRVTLWVSHQKEEALTGTLVEGPELRGTPVEASPYFMSAPPAGRREAVRGVPSPTVLLRTSRGTVAVRTALVTRAEFDEDGLRRTVSSKRKRPSIRMELERPASGEKVSITCLARGLTWAPGYLIDLSDPETARLSARALVVNELTDLEGVELELVTGYPNIRFGEVRSPLALSETLADFLSALARGHSGARVSGGVLGQQVLMNRATSEGFQDAPPLPSYSAVAEGTVSEDLFFYPVEDFRLGRGETAWVPLFSADMPYEHIYTWSIPDVLDESGRRPRSDSEPELGEVVWHSCRLLNTLEMPLTTAPAEFVTAGRFTGQDICYYTAPGTRTTIRINRAMNVLARQAEVELERTRNAARFYGSSYDLVKVRGELSLQSRLEEQVKMEVTKELSGEVLLSEPAAEDLKTARGLQQVNPNHRLTWTLKLPPGTEQKLVYEYEVYIRG